MRNSKVLTLIVLVLTVIQVNGQDANFNDDPVVNNSDNRSFRLGLHFSPNISRLNVNTSGFKNNGSKVGFAYGLSTEFFLAKNYLLSTGISFNSLGGKLSYEGLYDNNGALLPSSIKEDFIVKYVDVPFTLKLRTNEIGYITYFGNFGLNTSYRYKSISDFEYTDFGGAKENDKNTSSDIKFMNISLVVGGGIEYNLSGNTNILLGLTYQNGFTNVLDKKAYVLGSDGKASFDSNGNPVESNKSANATMNYFSFNIGVYF